MPHFFRSRRYPRHRLVDLPGRRALDQTTPPTTPEERVRWSCATTLRKFQGDWTFEQIQAGLAGEPYEVVEADGNMLVNAGVLGMLQLLCTRGSPVAFSNANARIGVGDSTVVAGTAQTDLQSSTNKIRVAMDTGFPKVGTPDGLATDNIVIFSATFGSGVAEWGTGWQEWAVFNAGAAGTMLNRKVENKGIKPTLTTWQFQVQIQIS